MDLNKIIETAKILARPYIWTAGILGFLLILSVCANIYLASREIEVTFDANGNIESVITQTNE